MQVNFGEDFRVFSGALSLKEGFAAFHCLARLLQDADHIEIAATAKAQQEHFHGPHTQVATAAFWRTIHYDHMTAARFTEEHGFASPLDACLHRQDSTAKKGSPA